MKCVYTQCRQLVRCITFIKNIRSLLRIIIILFSTVSRYIQLNRPHSHFCIRHYMYPCWLYIKTGLSNDKLSSEIKVGLSVDISTKQLEQHVIIYMYNTSFLQWYVTLYAYTHIYTHIYTHPYTPCSLSQRILVTNIICSRYAKETFLLES